MKIIRTRQRPFLVVIDVLFTVLAWVGLVYLLVNGLWPLFDSQAGAHLGGSLFDTLGTLQIYGWIALVNAVLLITWARYQQRKSRSFAQRRLPAPVVDDQGLSDSFKLTDERLDTLRQPGSKIIHNNQDGDISHVVAHFHLLSPELQPPPLAPLERPRVIHLPADRGSELARDGGVSASIDAG